MGKSATSQCRLESQPLLNLLTLATGSLGVTPRGKIRGYSTLPEYKNHVDGLGSNWLGPAHPYLNTGAFIKSILSQVNTPPNRICKLLYEYSLGWNKDIFQLCILFVKYEGERM